MNVTGWKGHQNHNDHRLQQDAEGTDGDPATCNAHLD